MLMVHCHDDVPFDYPGNERGDDDDNDDDDDDDDDGK